MTNQEYINHIAPLIVNAAVKLGYNYPSAIIAQACVESGYGRSVLAYKYHNHFGMKCGRSWKGKSVNLATKEEYTPGTLTSIIDNFRVYDNDAAGVSGYFDFISWSHYANLKSAKSPLDYCRLLKEDGYATSSSYVTTLNNCITLNNLTDFDPCDTVSDPSGSIEYDTRERLITEIIAGKWGNGPERVQKLKYAYIDAAAIQQAVNERLKGV